MRRHTLIRYRDCEHSIEVEKDCSNCSFEQERPLESK